MKHNFQLLRNLPFETSPHYRQLLKLGSCTQNWSNHDPDDFCKYLFALNADTSLDLRKQVPNHVIPRSRDGSGQSPVSSQPFASPSCPVKPFSIPHVWEPRLASGPLFHKPGRQLSSLLSSRETCTQDELPGTTPKFPLFSLSTFRSIASVNFRRRLKAQKKAEELMHNILQSFSIHELISVVDHNKKEMKGDLLLKTFRQLELALPSSPRPEERAMAIHLLTELSPDFEKELINLELGEVCRCMQTFRSVQYCPPATAAAVQAWVAGSGREMLREAEVSYLAWLSLSLAGSRAASDETWLIISKLVISRLAEFPVTDLMSVFLAYTHANLLLPELATAVQFYITPRTHTMTPREVTTYIYCLAKLGHRPVTTFTKLTVPKAIAKHIEDYSNTQLTTLAWSMAKIGACDTFAEPLANQILTRLETPVTEPIPAYAYSPDGPIRYPPTGAQLAVIFEALISLNGSQLESTTQIARDLAYNLPHVEIVGDRKNILDRVRTAMLVGGFIEEEKYMSAEIARVEEDAQVQMATAGV